MTAKKIDPFIVGVFAYWLGVVVSFGNAHSYFTKTTDCEKKVWCMQPGEKVIYSAIFWPLYVSVRAWEDESQ
jgi:hypothetical protein